MQLICLGGAAAWPNPGQGCSSYIVRDGDTTLLLDCGPDTLLELRKHADLRGVDAVVISHAHSDHVLDLVTYRYALVYAQQSETPTSTDSPIPLYLPPGGEERIRALGEAVGGQGEADSTFWEPEFELREYDPDRDLDVNQTRVSFMQTQHFTPCYAMRISGSDGSLIVYGADTGAYEPLVPFSSGAGLLIAEATAKSEWKLNSDKDGHISPRDAGEWASRAGVDLLVLTHLWCERPDTEVLSQARESFTGPISIAKPGAKFDV